MRIMWGTGVLVVAFTFLIAGGRVASAETMTASGQLEIKATVAPARFIVVNNWGTITQIVGNTSEDVTPRVFRGDISAANELPLTQDIYRKYQRHVPTSGAQPGVLYEYGVPQMFE